MRKTIFFIILMLCSSPVFAKPNIVICLDRSFWYPFTFVKDGTPTGMHIDIVTKALDMLGYKAKFVALPWKRCLKQAESGGVDAIATASYKRERAEFLRYPVDATSAKKSEWRVMQVEYVVITPIQNDYEFNGNIMAIPAPILAPSGYSIASDLKKRGLRVDDSAPGDINNVKKLVRARVGSMVSIPGVINILAKNPEYRGKLKISTLPLQTKSYFLPISKKSKLSIDDQQAIWSSIAEVRDDIVFMAEISTRY